MSAAIPMFTFLDWLVTADRLPGVYRIGCRLYSGARNWDGSGGAPLDRSAPGVHLRQWRFLSGWRGGTVAHPLASHHAGPQRCSPSVVRSGI